MTQYNQPNIIEFVRATAPKINPTLTPQQIEEFADMVDSRCCNAHHDKSPWWRDVLIDPRKKEMRLTCWIEHWLVAYLATNWSKTVFKDPILF